MSEEKLKPCPFCGGEAIMATLSNEFDTVYNIACIGDVNSECIGLLISGFYEEKADVVKQWNRRKP